ncbi:hypothetical protein EDB84DRAFT_1399659 [Lactarius hengduanensis]|nr:hypothetical protein EDB84DRAFT_1399659 [Lactarius hengduanensis]
MSPDYSDTASSICQCLCTNQKSDLDSIHQRRLIVAFDGTENQFGPWSSHVVEFYSRIMKSANQRAYYTSGIGTFVTPSSPTRCQQMWIKNKWASVVALHFKSDLLSAYQFLSDKYKKGDQIFLLGFSRGAYQARILAAMITKVGLLYTCSNEQIQFAFKMYMDLEASTTTTMKWFKKTFCQDVNIHFVGVWDTISSVGLFRNKYYPGVELAENICFFRHALALDERRVKFLPEYIFAKKESFSAGEFGRPRCKEVWFRGSHSDICDNGAIPSRWMAYEAMLAGLNMTPLQDGIKVKDLEPNTGKDPMTPLYKLLEYAYFLIKWEVHSEGCPPLLTNNNNGKPPLRHFSRLVITLSLMPTLSQNKATKSLALQTS